MIEAAIFDMDGVIIDSEPFWKEADILVYGKLGIELTPQMCAQATGLDTPDAIKYWYNYKPWTGSSFKKVQHDIESHVIKCVTERGCAVEGLLNVFNFFHTRSIPIALASASSMQIIEAVLVKLNVKHHFKVYHSSEFEVAGKPNPAVYLATAKMLNVNPANCIVFEDSINGLKAGLAAGMKVVAIPDVHLANNAFYKQAHLILNKLAYFNETHFNNLESRI